jgi:hypothetical protein
MRQRECDYEGAQFDRHHYLEKFIIHFSSTADLRKAEERILISINVGTNQETLVPLSRLDKMSNSSTVQNCKRRVLIQGCPLPDLRSHPSDPLN